MSSSKSKLSKSLFAKKQASKKKKNKEQGSGEDVACVRADSPGRDLNGTKHSSEKGSKHSRFCSERGASMGRGKSVSLVDKDELHEKASKLTEQLRRALTQQSAAAVAVMRATTAGAAAGYQAAMGKNWSTAEGSGSGEDEVDGAAVAPPPQAAATAAGPCGLAAQIDDNVLLCSVCLECYREPKVLPCQHTYCRECLETIVNSQMQKFLLACPDCRLEVNIPQEGVKGLPTNFIINKLVDVLQMFRVVNSDAATDAATDATKAVQVLCDACRENGSKAPAIAVCRDCNVNMCGAHSTAHSHDVKTSTHNQAKLNRDSVDGTGDAASSSHRQETARSRPPTAKEAFLMKCNELPCNPMAHASTERWCNGCSTFVCNDCDDPIHRSHDVVTISTAFLDKKDSIQDKLTSLLNVVGKMESAVTMLDECQSSIEEEVERVSYAIHACFQRLIDDFAARRCHLMDEVVQEKTSRCKTLRLQKEYLLFQVGNLRSGVESIANVVSASSEEDLLRQSDRLQSKANKLLKSPPNVSPEVCPGMRFDCGWEKLVHDSMQQFGQVNYAHVSPALCTANGLGLSRKMTRGKDAAINVSVVNSNGEPCDETSGTVTVVVYPPSSPRDHSLSSDTSSANTKSIISPASTSPSCLSSYPSLSSNASQDTRLSSPPSRLVAHANSESQQKGTYTCSYIPNEEGEYVVEVCVNGWPIKDSPFIAKVKPGRDYSSIAGHTTRFGREGKGDSMFRTPQGIAIDNQGLVHVADMDNNRIQVFNADGGCIHCFGNRGPNPGQFIEPIGVAIDADGHIIVADQINHRVQVLRHNGQSLRNIGVRGSGTGKFSLPFFVAPFTHGTRGPCYAVTEFGNNRVQIVQSDGMSVSTFGSKGSGKGQFLQPAGIAVSGDLLIYVADHNNHRIQVFDIDGKYQTEFGTFGTCSGELNRPCGVTLDAAGNVLVSEYSNNRMQVFSANKYESLAVIGKSSDLKHPTGIAVDKTGKIYLASEHHITVF